MKGVPILTIMALMGNISKIGTCSRYHPVLGLLGCYLSGRAESCSIPSAWVVEVW